MSKYIRWIILCLPLVMGYGCMDEPDMDTNVRNAAPPSIRLLTGTSEEYILGTTATTITLQAEVLSANGLPVEAYGVCWGLDPSPVVESGDTVISGTGIGEYESTAVGLEADTTYYIRPYATNEKGTSYGEELSVSTQTGLGVVQTLDPADVKAESAFLGGRLLALGEGDIVKRGVYLYETSLNDPSPRTIEMEAQTDSLFSATVENLEPSTRYYVQAFVENRFGMFPLPAVKSFYTTSGKPEFKSMEPIARDYSSITFRAVFATLGDADIEEAGFCYRKGEEPAWTDTSAVQVPCVITNDSIMIGVLDGLEQQTQYFVKAYARNKYGEVYFGEDYTFYAQSSAPTVSTSAIDASDMDAGTLRVEGSILDKGETDIVGAGFVWSSTNQQPTIGDAACDSIMAYQGDSIFVGNITELRGGTTYYVRAFAYNASNVYSYGAVQTVETPAILTSLTAYPGEAVTEASYCVLNNIGYILGGDLGRQRSASLFMYNMSTDEWAQRNPIPEAVKSSSFFALNDFTVISFGGKDDNNHVTNGFYGYAWMTNEWTELNSGGYSLSDAAGISLDNEAYILGGFGVNDTINDKVLQFIPSGSGSWTELPSRFPDEQVKSILVRIGDRFYAGLGRTSVGLSGISYSKALWSSADMSSWSSEEECPTEAEGVVAGVACGDKLYVLDTNLDLYVFDPATDSWAKQPTSIRSSLQSSNLTNIFMFAYNGYLYIGQTSGSKHFVRYTPGWDH